DEVAKNVLFALAKELVGIVWILLPDVIFKLILAAEKLRASNDLAVHPRHDFFDNLPGSEGGHQRNADEYQKHSFHKISGGPPRCLGLRAKVGYGRWGILLLQDGTIPP